jgi:O-antigen ligase
MRKVAGGGSLVLLSILLWLIVYQNLPTELHGMSVKPLNTAGPIDRYIKIGTITIGACVIAARWSLVRLLAKNANLGLVAFMVLVPLSALWSVDSTLTLRRFTSLAAIVLMCVAISLVGWNRRRFQQVALPPLVFILVASLLVGIVHPDKVIELGTDVSLNDAWHGITYQKNQFGMTASVVAIICFNRWLARASGTFWSIAGLTVALTCLVFSRSSTSLLATVLGMFFMVLVMRVPVIKQRYSTYVVVGIAATILIYELAVQNVIPGSNTLLSPIAKLMGKDMTFSSRSIIWETIKEHIRASPWLGTGYGAYWTTLPNVNSPSYVFMYVMYFYPGEAHNGYLDIVNDLGYLGLACLLMFLVWYIRQALQLMRFDRGQAAMYLALLFQQMVANLSESEWFSRSTICTILILGATCLSREVLEHRRHAQLAASARRPS